MKWIFLIGNETFNVETVKKLKHADMVCSYDEDGRYCVDFGDDHIFYEQMTNIDEFEERVFGKGKKSRLSKKKSGDLKLENKKFTTEPFGENGKLKPNIKYRTGEYKYFIRYTIINIL